MCTSRHHDTCPQSFQLQNDANFTLGLHSEVQVKKNMLVELCAWNDATHDGIVNGANGIFQSTKVFNQKKSYGYYLIIPNVVNSQE